MTIAILGAGEIGAATARQLAARSAASRVVLIDEAASVAQGKALDIAQAAPVDRYDVALSGTADESAVMHAGIVILADRTGTAGEWADEAGLALIARVTRLNSRAPIVCAGVRQRPLIDRGVRELGVPATRLFGTAPEALRGGVVSLVALEAEMTPADIALLVVGRPPHEIIVSWDTASLGGRRLTDVLSPPVITRLDARLPRLWPPGPHALGSAAARVLAGMTSRTPRTHILDVVVPREASPGGSAAMLPVRLSPRGVDRIEAPPLSARDRVRLETALAH